MKKVFLFLLIGLFSANVVQAFNADSAFITPFERSNGKQTATYTEAMDFYKKLCAAYPTLMMGDVGITDIGYPLRAVYYTKDGKFTREDWRRNNRIVILINNDIHPGEPDG